MEASWGFAKKRNEDRSAADGGNDTDRDFVGLSRQAADQVPESDDNRAESNRQRQHQTEASTGKKAGQVWNDDVER
jgi:hypothetical protein